MRRSPFTLTTGRAGLVALVLVAPMALAACDSSDERKAAPDAEATTSQEPVAVEGEDPATMVGADAGGAELMMAGQSFSFDLAACVIDDTSVVAHGPGRDGDSDEPAYLDVDIVHEPDPTTGGATITLGATDLTSQGDGAFILSIDSGHEYVLSFDVEQVQLMGDFYFDGNENLGPGTLTVGCH